jgi:hypothetical protein
MYEIKYFYSLILCKTVLFELKPMMMMMMMMMMIMIMISGAVWMRSVEDCHLK